MEAKVTILIDPAQLLKNNKKTAKAKRIILDSMEDHLIPHFIEKKSAKDMYDAFITLY